MSSMSERSDPFEESFSEDFSRDLDYILVDCDFIPLPNIKEEPSPMSSHGFETYKLSNIKNMIGPKIVTIDLDATKKEEFKTET